MSGSCCNYKITPRWKREIERMLDIIKHPVDFLKFLLGSRRNNYVRYAKNEFKRLRQSNPDAIVLRYQKNIIGILKKLKKEGLSGGSAPYYASILGNTVKNLALFNVISPIYNMKSEWNSVYHNDDDESVYQNKLQSALFKDGSDGKPYFLDAIIFREGHSTFTSGNCAGYKSSQYVKTFPFMPKKFVVDVELNKETDEYTIVDQKQIDEVFKYYDEYKVERRVEAATEEAPIKVRQSTDKQKKNGKNRA
jgi:hypothetical protein